MLSGRVILDTGKRLEWGASRTPEVALPCNVGPTWGGGFKAMIAGAATAVGTGEWAYDAVGGEAVPR